MKPAGRLGIRGERMAGRWLRRRGWRVLHRNHRIGPDEIDIIAESPDGRLVACIEVKTSSRKATTPPLRRVDGSKRHHMMRSARRVASGFPDKLIRIDVITVKMGHWPMASIRHIENAVFQDNASVSGFRK
ncbi:MAG: YraN family protein [Phycisphaerales bacterium]|nr:YraN family protein [Phycisphaerales bacterium]